MKADAKWVGHGYPLPKRWPTKGAMGRLNPGITAIKVQFRFEVAWVALETRECTRICLSGLAGGFESWCPIWDMHLVEYGRVIGPQDFDAAKFTPMEAAWRGAAVERRKEDLMASGQQTEGRDEK